MGGFGRSPFGKGPFGKSDVGTDLVVQLFPEEYMSPDLPPGTDPKDNDLDPLLKLLKVIAYMVNLRRSEIDDISALTDTETADLTYVRLMGKTLGLNIDKNDPDFLQRTFVGNASQWLQIKASTKGYQVRGLASGFEVEIVNFWRVDPAIATAYIPLRNQFFLKPDNADDGVPTLLHTDSPPGTHAGTPTEETEKYAKSSYIQVVFTIAEPRNPDADYNTLLDLVIDKIRDVVGIHHEFIAAQFRIEMDVDITVLANIDRIDEDIARDYNFNEFNRYDIIAADEVPCDADPSTVEIAVS